MARQDRHYHVYESTGEYIYREYLSRYTVQQQEQIVQDWYDNRCIMRLCQRRLCQDDSDLR